VKPAGKTSEKLAPLATPLPAELETVMVYVAVLGTVMGPGVLVVLVTVSAGKHAAPAMLLTVSAAVVVALMTPAEPSVVLNCQSQGTV
jgi:hypothetical protein